MHFISLKYFSSQEINKLIGLASQIKSKPSEFKEVLKDKCIGLIFEKPSLRTKTAFYVGALQLGAEAIYYTSQEVKLGTREQVCDVSRTLSRYLDLVTLRLVSHESILEFAKFSSIPVVNGLSSFLHPSQVLADILTIQELKGDIKKLKVAYIGDGNNVCNSLIYAFSILGGNLKLATPQEYLPSEIVLSQAEDCHKASGAKVSFSATAQEAARDADVLYTDVWASMGQEDEAGVRKNIFKDYQINDKILAQAKKDCIVMHCLPAHRGEEITDSVIDSKNSAVFLQAENRLHAAKAILAYILTPKILVK